MRNVWCALWHSLYFHSLSACLLVICTLSRSCSVSLSYTRTRTKTISFSVFISRANRGLHLPPSLPPPFPTLPHSLACTSGLVASFMWDGESPSSAPVPCAQRIGHIQDPRAAHALDLMLACLNQVLKYPHKLYMYLAHTRIHEFTDMNK